jgi:hypothetical protein
VAGVNLIQGSRRSKSSNSSKGLVLLSSKFSQLILLTAIVLAMEACRYQGASGVGSLAESFAKIGSDSDQSASATIDYMFSEQGTWIIAAVPATGLDASALVTGDRMKELIEATQSLKNAQYLIAILEGKPAAIYLLKPTDVRIDQAFIVSGTDDEVLHAAFKKEPGDSVLRLVSFGVEK